MVGDDRGIPATGHLTMPDVAWEQARLRTRLTSEPAERDPVGLDAAEIYTGFDSDVYPTDPVTREPQR